MKKKFQLDLPTEYGSFDLIAYEQINSKETHIALKKGVWSDEDEVMDLEYILHVYWRYLGL